MSEKHDIDNLFQKSFQDHQEEVNLSDWNDFVNFKEEKDKDLLPLFFKTKYIVLSLVAFFVLGTIVYHSSKEETLELSDDVQLELAKAGLNNDPSNNKKQLDTSLSIEKSQRQSNESNASDKTKSENKSLQTNSNKSPLAQKQNILSRVSQKSVNPKAQLKLTVDKNQNGLSDVMVQNIAEQKSIVGDEKENEEIIAKLEKEIDNAELIQVRNKIETPEIPLFENTSEIDLNKYAFSAEFEKIKTKKSKKGRIGLFIKSETYPYGGTGNATFVSGSFGVSYQRSLNEKFYWKTSLAYSLRTGNYNYSQQDTQLNFAYRKTQNNYALVPEFLNLINPSLSFGYEMQKSRISAGLSVDYLMSVAGHLYHNTNTDGLQASETLTMQKPISSLGLIDKTGFNDFQFSTFVAYDFKINSKLDLIVQLNYLVKPIAQKNAGDENILTESNPLLGEFGLQYKF